jgi:LPXTG-motif cell wall-anchored protein
MYGGELPFTGSVFTLPLVILGLVLSIAGWIMRRASRKAIS